MPLGAFYQQVIGIALGAVVAIFWCRRECNRDLENIEDALSQEWYLIQSYIWSNDVKSSVERFVSFIQEETSRSDSEDRYSELFANVDMIRSTKAMLDELIRSYATYSDFSDILSDLAKENMELKKWLDRMILATFGCAIWGAAGLWLESASDIPHGYLDLHWGSFALLIVLSLVFLFQIVHHYRRCGALKANVRLEKSRYREFIETGG